MPESLRIAIADDDRSTRELLQRMIAHLGHSVVATAENGETLIAQCKQVQPDVVITDNMMADVNGMDAALEIYKSRPLPIVLLSGYCDPKLVRSAEEKHVLVYLVKPISEAHLEAALARCTEELRAAPMRELDEQNDVLMSATEQSGDSRFQTRSHTAPAEQRPV
ncbi:MAG TPA: response regulator [Pirellulales bacterium]|jgi:YesN/AraC family two-component response regulator